MKKKLLKKYANLVIRIGANVQRGQDVVIFASTNQAEFVKYLAEEAYKVKARKITVEWNNEKITRLKWKKESLSVLKDIPKHILEKKQYLVNKLPARIYVDDANPDAMHGINMKKVAEVNRYQYPIYKRYTDQDENRYQWTIVAMPSIEWSKAVFPELTPKASLFALEKAIIKCMRLDEENPTASWEAHIAYLQDKAAKMNAYNFDFLTYKASNGTDFKVGIQKNHEWLSAREKHLGGIEFSANMPTEEVFTMPAKFSAEGKVVATKPLSYRGNIIEDFEITFKEGKAANVYAKTNQSILEEMIKMDKGSAYLGEVALVPFNSPINETNILFYNTLFDENACCHLALGNAFKNNIKDYADMEDEDFKNVNYNESLNHVDFMIGSADLSVVGTTFDGQEVQVFKDGIWNI